MRAGETQIYFRTMLSINGVSSHDGVSGQYLISSGLTGYQPSMTRSAVINISAEQTIQFGAFLGSVESGAVGGFVFVQTSYFCS